LSVFNQSRKNVISLLFIAITVVMVLQLFNLQVLNTKYSLMADEQGKFRKVVYPDRGIIYDRKNRAILQNTTTYDLMVIPGKIKGTDTTTLCTILGIDTAEFRKRIITAIIKNKSYRPSVFEALLSEEKIANLNENMYKFAPGYYLQERPVRDYPYDVAGNILGYLGEVDSNFLKKRKGEGYQLGDYTGIDGLERSYEKVLMGQRGIEFWKRDNKNRLTERLENGRFDTASVAGKSMYLSLDIELQELGEKLMENKVGAVVALDPQTGGVLAMVSSPTFKPRLLTGASRKRNYADLLLDPRQPLINRTINGYYSPGSTFKTLQGLIALQEGVITTGTTTGCGGAYYGCNRRIGCHAVGTFNLRGAISHSCNTYFEIIFRKIVEQQRYPSMDSALNKWAQYMNAFGMGKRLGIDMPSEKRGLIPNAAYYDKHRGDGKWNSCGIISVSIGQGEVNSTVLQLANAIAIIANKGWYYTPHMVDSIEDGDKFNMLDTFKIKHNTVQIPDSMFEAVHDGMQDVMEGGTGRAHKIKDIVVCGKTGTVENSYKGVKQKDHAFFAAFAPRENPRIAIAVICENAGYGATSSAPIASLMIEKYLKDSITDKARLAKVEAISKMNLIPPRIYKELRIRDSIVHAKDSAYLIAKGYIKIIKDTLGLDETGVGEAVDEVNKNKRSDKEEKRKPEEPKSRVQFIYPDKRKENETSDSANDNSRQDI
jgi:penicillin-binding protein 2